jgi:hypothetical protein
MNAFREVSKVDVECGQAADMVVWLECLRGSEMVGGEEGGAGMAATPLQSY